MVGRADYYEVALLLGACFLVNYITADSKTNWVEVCFPRSLSHLLHCLISDLIFQGLIMVSFYMMIVRPPTSVFARSWEGR